MRVVVFHAGGATSWTSALADGDTSAWLLEVRALAGRAALADALGEDAGALGEAAEAAVTPDVARALARAAWRRAVDLTVRDGALERARETRFVGVGLTAALTRANGAQPRGGGRCFCATARSDCDGIVVHGEVEWRRPSTRLCEQLETAELLLERLRAAERARLYPHDVHSLVRVLENLERTTTLGVVALLPVRPRFLVLDRFFDGHLVVPGSFNPLHDGHLAMLRRLPRRPATLIFEISLRNVDKSSIDAAEMLRRASQFEGRAVVCATNAPLFRDKARLFPGATFLVGADTVLRLARGPVDDVDLIVNGAHCRFVVGPRGGTSGEAEVRAAFPVALVDRGFRFLGGEEHPASSTAVRERSMRADPDWESLGV